MKFRNLRIAWSIGWGLGCLLLIMLWVRSYWVSEEIDSRIADYPVACESQKGRLRFTHFPANNNGWDVTYEIKYGSWHYSSHRIYAGLLQFVWGFGDDYLNMPHWVFVFAASVAASLPWLRWRFSLRTLLIATTLVAMVLGLAVWSAKK
jgi:hypothetical protein